MLNASRAITLTFIKDIKMKNISLRKVTFIVVTGLMTTFISVANDDIKQAKTLTEEKSQAVADKVDEKVEKLKAAAKAKRDEMKKKLDEES